jgi:Ca-activated chloride channel homolog
LGAIAGKPIHVDTKTKVDGLDKVDIGYYGSAAVVLFSDGENTSDPKPADMAKLASVAGVKIFPVGVGTTAGTVLKLKGFSLATALDEAVLKDVAKITNGTYQAATEKTAVASVYNAIGREWKRQKSHTELTGAVTAGSALLLLIGAGLSLRWFGRVV